MGFFAKKIILKSFLSVEQNIGLSEYFKLFKKFLIGNALN